MDAVVQILEHLDMEFAEMELNDLVTVDPESEAMDELTIEKIGDDLLSVGHYYTQRGDLMRDPEVVFRVDGDRWWPIEFRRDGTPQMHDHNEDGIDLRGFDRHWNKNLKNQGYVDAATDPEQVEVNPE